MLIIVLKMSHGMARLIIMPLVHDVHGHFIIIFGCKDMRIHFFILITLVFWGAKASAQRTKSVELKPIVKQGWKYYYDGRRVKTPYALQIPLEALEDREINERLRKFKKYQVLQSVTFLPALIYLFTYDHRGYRSRNGFVNTYLLLAGGGLAGSIAFNALAHHQMSKAIDIYNFKIAEGSSIGLTINSLPERNFACVSYTYKF